MIKVFKNQIRIHRSAERDSLPGSRSQLMKTGQVQSCDRIVYCSRGRSATEGPLSDPGLQERGSFQIRDCNQRVPSRIALKGYDPSESGLLPKNSSSVSGLQQRDSCPIRARKERSTSRFRIATI